MKYLAVLGMAFIAFIILKLTIKNIKLAIGVALLLMLLALAATIDWAQVQTIINQL